MSRELDSEVAKKAMGLNVQFSNALGGDWVGTSIEEGYSRVRPYSTDISAAMEVVEKMRKSGSWCCIEMKSDYHYVWWVGLRRAESHGNAEHKITVSADAESLPEAICRAALKAIE